MYHLKHLALSISLEEAIGALSLEIGLRDFEDEEHVGADDGRLDGVKARDCLNPIVDQGGVRHWEEDMFLNRWRPTETIQYHQKHDRGRRRDQRISYRQCRRVRQRPHSIED